VLVVYLLSVLQQSPVQIPLRRKSAARRWAKALSCRGETDAFVPTSTQVLPEVDLLSVNRASLATCMVKQICSASS
jgi:hypothetical protein